MARLLFAELGRSGAANQFLRLDYDGSIHTNGGAFGRGFEDFGVISGTQASMARMEQRLREQAKPDAALPEAVRVALDAWAAGHLALTEEEAEPSAEQLSAHAQENLGAAAIEAAVLDKNAVLPVTWRPLADAELRPLLQTR